jgi:hypothetical protein
MVNIQNKIGLTFHREFILIMGKKASKKQKHSLGGQPESSGQSSRLNVTTLAPNSNDKEWEKLAREELIMDINVVAIKGWNRIIKVLPGIYGTANLKVWLKGPIFKKL